MIGLPHPRSPTNHPTYGPAHTEAFQAYLLQGEKQNHWKKLKSSKRQEKLKAQAPLPSTCSQKVPLFQMPREKHKKGFVLYEHDFGRPD